MKSPESLYLKNTGRMECYIQNHNNMAQSNKNAEQLTLLIHDQDNDKVRLKFIFKLLCKMDLFGRILDKSRLYTPAYGQ